MISSVVVTARRLNLRSRSSWKTPAEKVQSLGRLKRKLRNKPSGQAVGYRDRRRWMFLLCNLSGRDGGRRSISRYFAAISFWLWPIRRTAKAVDRHLIR
jgi:hypothetical protein